MHGARSLLVVMLLGKTAVWGQEPAVAPAPAAQQHGTVLFSTEHPPQAPAAAGVSSSVTDQPVEPGPSDQRPAVRVTDQERAAVAIVATKLDVHLIPASAREEVRAELTLRNVTDRPLTRLPLQLSSTLRWQTVSARLAGGVKAMAFTQSPIATDADHTGYAQEAVLTPAQPLAAGAEMVVSVFYSGTIAQTGARLELIGAPPGKANAAEWDAIRPTNDQGSTALRGFGDVLWYPVAAPAAVFGDTNRLFELIRRQRRQNAAATIALRLTVEYTGDPPDEVIFDSVAQPLTQTPDTRDQLVAQTHGVATAEFPAAAIGFRAPSLFLTAEPAALTDSDLLAGYTADADRLKPYEEASLAVSNQLEQWLGVGPTTPLKLLDHAGEPFEDGTLIVAPLSAGADAKAVAPELVRGLTHGWFDPQAPTSVWLNFGVAELMALVATEDLLGRQAAVGQLQEAYVLLALSEPGPQQGTSSSAGTGTARTQAGVMEPQPLTVAYSDPFLRYKSLAVLWQLREQLGEDGLKKALTAYRSALKVNPGLAGEEKGFEQMVERSTGRDLAWFFDDWVYRDGGLPDLSFGAVDAHPLPAVGGRSEGYLVAVEVRNDGGAVADVPITVRNEDLTTRQRIRVAAHASASIRVVFEGVPRTVEVNDGSVPEAGALVHTLAVHVAGS